MIDAPPSAGVRLGGGLDGTSPKPLGMGEECPVTDIIYICYIDIVNIGDMAYILHMPKQAVLTVKKLIALEPAMVEAIDNFRFEKRIKTEAEAIRQLLEIGLKSSRKRAK